MCYVAGFLSTADVAVLWATVGPFSIRAINIHSTLNATGVTKIATQEYEPMNPLPQKRIIALSKAYLPSAFFLTFAGVCRQLSFVHFTAVNDQNVLYMLSQTHAYLVLAKLHAVHAV